MNKKTEIWFLFVLKDILLIVVNYNTFRTLFFSDSFYEKLITIILFICLYIYLFYFYWWIRKKGD